MAKIVQLDEFLSNKIAAGEVVERPASVVKELVENAIDANSTIIEIYIEEAGLEKIRIVDNGDGIEPEDVTLAFYRHATSKIKDQNDLFRIRTLGFRGEALPSIASVSHLAMKTSTGDGPGTFIRLEGGKILEQGATSSRKGTDITVSQLFFNTPARLKYVKTVHTELGNISDAVNRLAIANPTISFKLFHHDKKLLQTSGNGNVVQVMASIYGIQSATKMIAFQEKTLDFTISGLAGQPELTRASRNYITVLVNGRYIKNYSITKAILDGYHTLLPIGRFPLAFISIEMDPLLVDVNVHPSKLEVRFSKEQELTEIIRESIKTAFKKETLIPSGVPVKKQREQTSEQTYIHFDSPKKEEKAAIKVWNQFIREDAESVGDPSGTHSWNEEVILPNSKQLQEEDLSEEDRAVLPEPQLDDSRIPPLYPIGQLHGTYILAQNERGLYLIDQHAAQERIKYEYFKLKVGRVEKELQEMLVPMTLEYSSDETVKLEQYKTVLEDVGVFLEPFGLNSFIVRAHPQWFPAGMEQQIIDEMINQVLTMKRVDVLALREEAAIMMSCKGSIKANRHLRNDEIQALLDELRQTNDPFTCPHGRPIIIHHSIYELEKMFKRVM